MPIVTHKCLQVPKTLFPNYCEPIPKKADSFEPRLTFSGYAFNPRALTVDPRTQRITI